MKKFAFMLVLVCGFLFSQSANAQRSRYYYYPDQDVYYNPGSRSYSWNENGNWTTNRQLPENMRVDRHARRVTVYHNNPNVWEDNEMHRRKYRRHDDEGDRRGDRDDRDNRDNRDRRHDRD